MRYMLCALRCSNANPQPCWHSLATTALQHVEGQLPQLFICVELAGCVELNVHAHLPLAAAHTCLIGCFRAYIGAHMGHLRCVMCIYGCIYMYNGCT